MHMTNDLIDFWCPFCGVKNVSETDDNETGVKESCPHFEGVLAMGEFIEGDVHGIFAAAQEKLGDVDEQHETGLTLLDILKKDLDDRYVAFDVGMPPPNPSGGVYLYNFDWHLRDSENLD